MKIEKLISAYLDGELSREQDKELRDAIVEDPFAKRQFDSSVDIHMALKEDAKNIAPPDDLVRETEDLVMMKILNKNKLPEVVESKRRKPVFYYLTAASVVLMLGFLFRIYEPGMFDNVLYGNQEFTYNQYIEELNPNTFDLAVPKSIDFKQTNGAKSENRSVVVSSSASNDLSSNDDINKSDTKFTSNYPIVNNKSYVSDNILPKESTSMAHISHGKNNRSANFVASLKETDIINASIAEINGNPYLILNKNLPNYTYLPANFQGNQIKISSFVANSLMNGGINSAGNKPILNYSQSIAYNSNENLSFGLEFGYMEFDSRRNVTSSGGNGEFTLPTSIEVQNPNDGKFVPPTLPVVVNNQLFWGAVFVNYDILKYNNLYVESRLGAGGTSSGPLSYGRLQAKYEIYDNIYLNLGSEGRLFIYSLDGKNLTGSSLSLIYGIQFAF